MAEPQSTSPDGNDSDAAPTKGKRRGFRRTLFIVIAILTVFVVYAFAFSKTDVSLEEVKSEQRQSQLFKILRALARPDLIRYDKEAVVIDQDVFIPCNGQEPLPPVPHESGATISVTPTCADPGEILTVTGSGFEPGQAVRINFVPISEFLIVLKQDTIDAAEDGTFTLSFEVPERASDLPQQVQAVAQTNIGSWFNRVEVWTDTNGNGIQEFSTMPESENGLAAHALILPEFDIRDPGGVTLIDDNNNVIDFISWGGSFEATTGSGTGHTSRDIEADPFDAASTDSYQLVGQGEVAMDFDWTGPRSESFGVLNVGFESQGLGDSLFFSELSFNGENQLEIAGPPGTSLKGATFIFFDGEDGKQYKSVRVSDQTNLSPRLSDNLVNTWDRIVETVMLALLATTVGTMLAIPLSFFAAKNLMRDVTVPVINLALSVIALPIGLVMGVQASRWAASLTRLADANVATLTILLLGLLGMAWFLLRWTFSPEEPEDSVSAAVRVLRIAGLVGVAFAVLIASYVVADLFAMIGDFFKDLLPAADFLGRFVATLGEVTTLGIPIFSALIGAFALALVAGKFGYFLFGTLTRGALNAATLIASAISGAFVGIAAGGIIDWFYQLENPLVTVILPALFGAAVGMVLSVKALRKGESQNIGLTIYYMSRTVFNGLRSIEPLVMVIIFVVWVGIGPFAGALALALHTTAALAKLYSEQVESIRNGPLEAVKATGATRLQTVVYAVVPQIIPPYISFTMYRWDINVRMSTIIGFAGGGGIGFLLQQNINLLQYRQAAAQMLAIAIVVASMDYVSSRLRERVV